jgi:hypothetical protein
VIEFNKKDLIAVLVLAVLALTSWLPRLKGPIDLRWDGGAYYVLGTSLAQGKGYRLLNEPGEIQTTLHPPLLPVIVALHQLALRTSDWVIVGWWLRIFYLILFVAYIVAAYFLIRIFLPFAYALLATLVSLLQLHSIFMSDLCFPEIPFGLATVIFALFNLRGGSTANRLIGTPLAIIAFALRTVGVSLLAAWAVESVCRRNFKLATERMLIALALIFGWAGYVYRIESGQEYRNPAYEYQRAAYNYINVSYARNMNYKDPFSPELGYSNSWDKLRRFLGNLSAMPASTGEAVSARESLWDLYMTELNRKVGHRMLPQWIGRCVLLLLAGFIAGGIWVQLARRQYFIPLYILFFLMSVSATPWPGQFNRYLSPLVPFLSLSLVLGVKAGADQISSLFSTKTGLAAGILTTAVAFLIVISQAAALFMLYTRWNQKVVLDIGAGKRIQYRLFFYDDSFRATDAGLDWLKRYGKSGDVLAATDPQWAYLRTGLKSVLPPFEMNAAKTQRLLDSVPVKYLVLDESVYQKYTSRVVATHPGLWRRVYADSIVKEDGAQGKFEIYERVYSQQE